ncbi:MAG TPA: patatin-like phospholipase family protein [Pyrinomonadaceae bacterium]|jgi:NTE family protein|nr:patatin-like phospholipase family protein [Pyrinomonadaceae bacterium]
MKVGLALSGGGARGFAHIGVLKALVENGIPIDMIAGTSAGSIVGAAYASGMSVDELYAMARRVGWLNMTRPSLSPLGALSNAPMGRFLARELGVARIEDLRMPFAAVGYDLTRCAEVVFKDAGDLIFAVRTSCAVPGVFAPLIGADGHLLVDGGVTTPLPVSVVRDMGADVVIAVDVLSCGAGFRSNAKTAAGMMIRSAMTLLRQVSIDSHCLADIVIEPAIAHIRPDQINKREELLRLGEEAALARLNEIKAVVSSAG